MGVIASQITSLTIVYSIVYSDADQRKHQSFASLVFVRGIHRGLVNSPHKRPVTRKMFPFDDVIMSHSAFVNRANKWYLIFISLYNEIHISLDNIKNQYTSQCLTSKKTSKLRVTGLCAGIHRGPVNSPHKRPVTRKMFPFDDVIMDCLIVCDGCWNLQWVYIR